MPSLFYEGKRIYSQELPKINHPMDAFSHRLGELQRAAIMYESPDFQTVKICGETLEIELEKEPRIGLIKKFWLTAIRAERRGEVIDIAALKEGWKRAEKHNKKVLGDAIVTFEKKLKAAGTFVPSLNGYIGRF